MKITRDLNLVNYWVINMDKELEKAAKNYDYWIYNKAPKVHFIEGANWRERNPKPEFNYPECLDRIVDVAVHRADAMIAGFKEVDRLKKEHDEMMSRLSPPPQPYDPCRYIASGGGGGGYSSFGYGGKRLP